MSTSRAELHRLLVHLEQSIPALIKEHPEDHDFMPIFAHEADTITAQAASEDHAWIQGQIGCMLDECGKSHENYHPLSDRR